ncbi:MAG: SpoIIIAH-like family protein [Huintestinicola sp.]|uniref:SpoIIIAH-like family protein n=1 Tax=Huintestinicola sp. TaxID=2981661 RepID=UPI003EFEF0D4
MRKPNLIIGKKQIILAGLTLVLGIAVYMNYVFSEVGEEIAADADISSAENARVNYGEAAFVNSDSPEEVKEVSAEVDSSDYFAQARLSRMTSRDDAVQTLSAILNGGDLTEEENAAYTMEAVNLSQLSESESKIESLIKAQGFEDCVVYLDGETASIVVRSEGLAADEAAQIKDILLTEVTIPAENIRIFEVK